MVRLGYVNIGTTTRRDTKMAGTKVLALVGSLRAASLNRQLAQLAAENAPDGVTVAVYQGLGGGLGELPFYNEDIDNAADVPASVTTIRAAVADADAILVVTPEYNGSIPGVLKNAIDWLSRPYGQSALNGKPLAVVGTSMGQYGGVWAHDETRKSFGIAGADVVDVSFSLPAAKLDGKAPRENAEVVEDLRDVLGKLDAEVA
jgi:NAD(P)H-dependent FMN reductase